MTPVSDAMYEDVLEFWFREITPKHWWQVDPVFDAAVQAESERLFTALGLAEQQDFALRHKAIVDRFGRYPHRNAILGRESTSEELEFLKQPGSSF
jgi:uncharacterized protein (DUF924 family)